MKNDDDIPTVEHPELARAGVNVSIGTANLLRICAVALGRTVGDGTLLRDAVADGNLENVTPTEDKRWNKHIQRLVL